MNSDDIDRLPWLPGEVAQKDPLEIRVHAPRSGGRFPLAAACHIPDGLGMYSDVEVKVDLRLGKIVMIKKPPQ